MDDHDDQTRARVIYDGDCAFCRKSIDVLRKLDWRRRLTYVNARDTSQTLLQQPPVAGAPLLEQMHVLTPAGRLYGGYAAIRWLAWRLPLLWPLAPLLYLPGASPIGNAAYRWVARHRFQLVPCQHGACQIKR
jgi:predicted DCC family thiol-disulfide oxidoreductase YuxK